MNAIHIHDGNTPLDYACIFYERHILVNGSSLCNHLCDCTVMSLRQLYDVTERCVAVCQFLANAAMYVQLLPIVPNLRWLRYITISNNFPAYRERYALIYYDSENGTERLFDICYLLSQRDRIENGLCTWYSAFRASNREFGYEKNTPREMRSVRIMHPPGLDDNLMDWLQSFPNDYYQFQR